MLFTVFCRISNILKNHLFWQTIRIWFEDNFTFLGPWGWGWLMRALQLVMWSEGKWEANEDISTNHQSVNEWMNELISNGGDCRTAPATPGLFISYKTTPNMIQIVKGHNSCIIKTNKQQKEQTETKTCSCPKSKKDSCILKGECLESGIIYQAAVTESQTNHSETYIGLTADPLKTR